MPNDILSQETLSILESIKNVMAPNAKVHINTIHLSGGNFTSRMSSILEFARLKTVTLEEIESAQTRQILKRKMDSSKNKAALNSTLKVSVATLELIRCEACLLRQRSILTKESRVFLEEYFRTVQYPDKHERRRISQVCHITPEKVRLWVRINARC